MKAAAAFALLLIHSLAAQDLSKVSISAKGVTAIGFSPDNQYFVIARGSNLQLYNAGNDTRIKEFTGAVHTRDVLDLSFSEHGNLLATGSADKKVKLWKIPEGELTSTFSDQVEPVIGVRIAPVSNTIISVGEKGTVIAWSAVTGAVLYRRQDFQKPVRAFDVSGNGEYFAVGGGDKFILVYETSTGNIIRKLEGHQGWIRALAFSPDGKMLASGSDGKTLLLWETSGWTKLREFSQKGWVYDLEFSADGKFLVAALEKTAIYFYNVSTGVVALRMDDFRSPVLKLSISANGRQVASVEEFGTGVNLSDISSLSITPVVHLKDVKDTSAPLILVSNPPNMVDNKVVIYKDIVDFRGIVSDESGIRSLRINGIETPIRQNGNFVINIPLAIGDNYVTLEVADINDNIALKKFVIIRKNAEGENYNPALAKNFLLAVGINTYQNWPLLNNAVKDANDVVTVLMNNYNFEFENVTVIKNEQATRSNVYNALRSLVEKVSAQDNLVVYFSGHGFFDELLNEGYWIPVDARLNSSGEYISNTEILRLLGSINSQHTFLVADACFSGALFADSRRGYTDIVEKYRSRWGLASGRLEAVSDGAIGSNSPFARRFIEFLKESNKDKFPVSELVQYVKTQVAEDTSQTPIGNPLRVLGDEGGEMVFYRKKQ